MTYCGENSALMSNELYNSLGSPRAVPLWATLIRLPFWIESLESSRCSLEFGRDSRKAACNGQGFANPLRVWPVRISLYFRTTCDPEHSVGLRTPGRT